MPLIFRISIVALGFAYQSFEKPDQHELSSRRARWFASLFAVFAGPFADWVKYFSIGRQLSG